MQTYFANSPRAAFSIAPLPRLQWLVWWLAERLTRLNDAVFVRMFECAHVRANCMFVHVCVLVFVRERERERECVCVCACQTRTLSLFLSLYDTPSIDLRFTAAFLLLRVYNGVFTVITRAAEPRNLGKKSRACGSLLVLSLTEE